MPPPQQDRCDVDARGPARRRACHGLDGIVGGEPHHVVDPLLGEPHLREPGEPTYQRGDEDNHDWDQDFLRASAMATTHCPEGRTTAVSPTVATLAAKAASGRTSETARQASASAARNGLRVIGVHPVRRVAPLGGDFRRRTRPAREWSGCNCG